MGSYFKEESLSSFLQWFHEQTFFYGKRKDNFIRTAESLAISFTKHQVVQINIY